MDDIKEYLKLMAWTSFHLFSSRKKKDIEKMTIQDIFEAGYKAGYVQSAQDDSRPTLEEIIKANWE